MLKRTAAVLMAVVGLTAVTPAPAEAHGRTPVKGTWEYSTEVDDVREVGCKTVLKLRQSDEFTGTIAGTSNPDLGTSTVVLRCNGSTTVRGTIHFDEVTVDGRTGSMVMRAWGRLAAGETEWTGRWRIIRAWDGLEGLRGHGSWWGPGAGGPNLPGYLKYEGNVQVHRHWRGADVAVNAGL